MAQLLNVNKVNKMGKQFFALTHKDTPRGFIVEEVIENHREAVGAQFIENSKPNAIEHSLYKVIILSEPKCSFAIFCDDAGGDQTITVEIEIAIGPENKWDCSDNELSHKTLTFHVQMTEYKHDTQLGCRVLTPESDCDFNEIESIAFNCADVVGAAEDYIFANA